ncbi:MAG: transcriptional activator NhaR [Planctomycetes bacterium]|nr:transcriptional activator NhaR [Planctomycetota bacterium]
MQWPNFHHLLYFWTIARLGTVAAAAEELMVTPQTISGQIRVLEEALGEKLFGRSGRNLLLTDFGRAVYGYADEIFSVGRELMESLRTGISVRQSSLRVGVTIGMPKLVAHEILQPALRIEPKIRLVCSENRLEALLADLATHTLDVVLADVPVPAQIKVQAYNHLLGKSGITFLGSGTLARGYRRRFPESLDQAPMLLPVPGTSLRGSLDRWFDELKIQPRIVGEFADIALLKAFGQAGAGIFPVPSVVEEEVKRQYRVRHIGATDEVIERFYAISVERRVRHPAMAAICAQAREELFA